jgi:hypothetical protein
VIGIAVLVAIGLGPLLFSSLTITIRNGVMEFRYGFGFWLKRFPIIDIVDVSLAMSSWAEGWGIRIKPNGMLYNVSGTRGVEVRLRRTRTDNARGLRLSVRRTTESATPAFAA